MSGFLSNLKKALLIGTIILLGFDVTLLFAAESSQANPPASGQSSTANNPELQQLQAQIKALDNNPQTPTPTTPTNSLTTGNSSSVTALPPISGSPPTSTPQIPPPIYQPGAAMPVQAPGTQSAQAPAAAPVITGSDINEAAFNSMVQSSLPMSGEQIQKLRSLYMASQFAATSVPGTPPRPTATSVFADLSPGATPPVIRLSQGFVTSLVFLDSTGSPWPIESYDVGNPSAFNIQWDKTSNTLMIQSTVLYTYGNMAIRLKGLNTPVMLTLTPGQKAVDYRVDLRVQGYGPNANLFNSNNNPLPNATSSDLLNILDGVPPPNSKSLKVEGGDCTAWLSGQKMYVRTRLNVLSPGWVSTLSSADGMHAYQMQPTPMLLVSQHGQVVQLKVEGF